MKFNLLPLPAALFAIFLFATASAADVAHDPAQNIRALNHLHMSLYKIGHYNNKAVLEEEYDTIKNNIKLDALADKKLIEIIQQLMDVLTQLHLDETEHKKMRDAYEHMQENLLLQTLQSGGQNLGKTALSAAMNSAQGFFSLGALGAAAGTLASLPALSSSFTKPMEDLQRQKNALAQFEWQLDKTKLTSLNDLNKKFLSTYWEFLQAAQIPDELRISEKQIETLLDLTREKNVEARYRNFLRLENEYKNLPEYWYYRADAAHDAMLRQADGGGSEKLAQDIDYCLEQYKNLAGVLRKDNLLASLLMLRLSTSKMPVDEMRGELRQIVDAFPLDGSKRLFAALTCLKYGLYDEAMEHLNANLDMRQYEVVSRKLLADIYGQKHDMQKETTLLRNILQEHSATNQEILYHLGKVPDAEKFLREFAPQISSINVRVENSLLGADNIEIILPLKWEILDDPRPATLEIDGKEIKSSEVSIDRDKNVVITFKKALSAKDLASRHAVEIKAAIQTSHFPIRISGTLEVSDGSEAKNADLLDTIVGMGKKIIPGVTSQFQMRTIACGDAFFELREGKWERLAARDSF